MADDNCMREIFLHDLELSKDLGVPAHLYANATKFIGWFGRFSVTINDRKFDMALTTSTLFINEPDPDAPIAHLTGSEWVETPIGRLFHADYMASEIRGGFQVFRKEDSSPFEGFELQEHTHMLVYTDGNGEKQFCPMSIDFDPEDTE